MIKEKGAVLIILALCLSVIMLFLALGVDTAILGSSHQKQSRTAELAALAAVEAFLAAPNDPAISVLQNNNNKLEAARLRVEQVVGFQLNNYISLDQTSQALTDQIGDSATPGERGALIPGQYFFSEPVGTCAMFNPALNNPSVGDQACPCPGGNWAGECFRPHLGPSEWDGGADDRPISSFRVNLYTSTASPAQTIFAQSGGAKSTFDLASSAMSTVTPRHVVFLIDLSSSMSENTHLYPGSDYSTPPFSSVAFGVGTSCVGGTSIGPTCSYPNETISLLKPRRIWSGFPVGHAGHLTWPDGMPICRDLTPPVIENIFSHYRDDYQCFEIDQDGDPTTNDTQALLVENGYHISPVNRSRFTDATGTLYKGPEPLSTVLSGVNETLRTLNILSVPGDQVTFIAHDRDVAATGPRSFGPVAPTDVSFQTLLRLTDHDGLDPSTRDDVQGLSKQVIDERIQGQLFPKPGALTDLSEAILRAYVILSQSPGAEISDNQVVVFGDGLGNCPHSDSATMGTTTSFPDPTNEAFLVSPTPGEINFVDPNKACNDDDDPAIPPETSFPSFEEYLSYVQGYSYFKSMTEVIAMVTGQGRPLLPATAGTTFESFVDNGFKFHTFLFGKHIQPHTMLRKGNNGCLTEGEAREEDVAFADPGDPGDSSVAQSPYSANEDTPFVRPNHDYQNSLVAPTNGRFFPIRTPCRPQDLNLLPVPGGPAVNSVAECNDGVGITRLNNFCDARSEAFKEVIPVTVPGLLTNGRLICDPTCLTENEQVNAGIGSLFKDNPIITVEPPPPVALGVPAN